MKPATIFSVTATFAFNRDFMRRFERIYQPKSTLTYGQWYDQCTQPNTIALTFDDGPGGDTAAILDALKEHNVKATFFVVGMNIEANAQVTKRIVAEGHQIASHTWDHKDLTTIEEAEIEHQMSRTNEEIEQLTGVDVKYMRPPYGAIDGDVLRIMKRLEFYVVGWNLDTNDWRDEVKAEPTQILSTYESATQFPRENGILSLNHDNAAAAQILPFVIRHFQSLKYNFVTVEECLSPDN